MHNTKSRPKLTFRLMTLGFWKKMKVRNARQPYQAQSRVANVSPTRCVMCSGLRFVVLIWSQALVKVEHMTSLPKRVIGRKEKFTNASLPSGCHDNAAWRRIFIPTYLQYLGSRDVKDAWSINDDEISLTLQKIWDYTYGAKVRQRIATDGAVFFIVSTLPSSFASLNNTIS
jgi:hypothetical protein